MTLNNQRVNNLSMLKWACRRGMLELDVLLNKFLNTAYETLSLDQKMCFSDLLQCPDPELFAWLMGHEQAELKFQEIIRIIREC